ncbi:hypothetical protein AVEN_16669-1 [Araneus ventricosus]|uniref:Lipase domain-containing protein n=1 Tax=Araneus ventricosus TaxID=182803 RepID=A0A4Y2U4L9_ARAVE|nr:hypothetical protein AVEN_16669-1 [Araneus ventricosus]
MDTNRLRPRTSQRFLPRANDDRECRFLAVHCSSYSKYEEGECPPQNSTVAEMGYHVKRTKLQPPARFYLRSNDKKPFCLEDGIRLRESGCGRFF